MKTNELMQKDDQELRQLEGQLRDELFRMRLKHFTGQLQKTSDLRQTRRNIARVKTILRQRGA